MTAPANITADERGLILHALGLTTCNGRMPRWAYRNYFVTSSQTDDYTLLSSLERRGLVRSIPYNHAPDSVNFRVLLLGVEALGIDVAKRVPAKLLPKEPA